MARWFVRRLWLRGSVGIVAMAIAIRAGGMAGMGATVVLVAIEREGELLWEHASKVLSIDHRLSPSHRSTDVNLGLSFATLLAMRVRDAAFL